MDKISKNIKVKISRKEAFSKFINEVAKWWPEAYTWSQETLADMGIDPKVNGLCTEIGPNNFRCDWGTVMEIQTDEYFTFKWQISINRSPIPNPKNASTVKVIFNSGSEVETNIELEHTNFENHGGNYREYLQALDSDKGWALILNKFKEYCEI